MRWMYGMSSKPFVVRYRTRAPRVVRTALIPIVVPTTTSSTSAGSMPASRSAASTVPTGSSGFDATLARNEWPSASTATRSVNVPPVSIPTLIGMSARTIPFVASEERSTAVDEDRLAGDHRALARGEEDDEADEVLRLLVAANGLVGDDRVRDTGIVPLRRLGLHHARDDHVHRDPARRELACQDTGEAGQRRLCGHVVQVSGCAAVRHDR